MFQNPLRDGITLHVKAYFLRVLCHIYSVLQAKNLAENFVVGYFEIFSTTVECCCKGYSITEENTCHLSVGVIFLFVDRKVRKIQTFNSDKRTCNCNAILFKLQLMSTVKPVFLKQLGKGMKETDCFKGR